MRRIVLLLTVLFVFIGMTLVGCSNEPNAVGGAGNSQAGVAPTSDELVSSLPGFIADTSGKDIKEPTNEISDLIIDLLEECSSFDLHGNESGVHTGSALYLFDSESVKGSYEMKGSMAPKSSSLNLTCNGEIRVNGNKIKFEDTVFRFSDSGIKELSGNIYLDDMKVKFEDIEFILGDVKQTAVFCVDTMTFCNGTLSTVEYNNDLTSEEYYKVILDVKKNDKSVQLCFSNTNDEALYYDYFGWIKTASYCSKLEYVCVDGVFYNPKTIADVYPLSQNIE